MNIYSRFFDEIFSSPIIATHASLLKYNAYLQAVKDGKILTFPDRPALNLAYYDPMQGFAMPDNKNADTQDSVAVIPVHGLLTRFGSWWDYGAEDYTTLLNEAYANDSVKAVVMDFECDGGTPNAMVVLADAIKRKNKPVYGCVNMSAYSAACYSIVHCNGVYASNNMARIGSVGIVSTTTNADKYYKDLGIEFKEVYPPESDWKNKESRDLKKGDESTLINEILSPWAIHFQDTVKANRPKLDLNVPGIISGRSFFANAGEFKAVDIGFIDGIKPLDELVKYAFTQSVAQKAKQLFT